MLFALKSQYTPTGDQPTAIKQLTASLAAGAAHQTLLGVTGSGKTFTMANVIERLQKPALIISHNKTLAAQLYEEFKEFFPDNAVHYFVSYYDYYQPEAYIPQSDTYIEKDAKINEQIDALRHAATASVLTRPDTIIVASVSCIYGVGSPAEYEKVAVALAVGAVMTQKELLHRLVLLQYVRNPIDPKQGHFRTRENTIEIFLPNGEEIVSVAFEKNLITHLKIMSASVRDKKSPRRVREHKLFPAKHFVTPQDKLSLAIANIKQELADRLAELKKQNKVLEAARLKQRTEYDIEMLRATGYVNGIENYSRHMEFREPGSAPHTLIDYFRHAHGEDFLTFIDESHATIPQLRGMYAGDRSRKNTLVNYGFRLPSAIDNRPLTFDEFNAKIAQLTYVSATPSAYELEKSRGHIAEQVIRPTGILDPAVEVRPTAGQIKDVIREVKARIIKNERSLVLALTKRLAEDIADYLAEAGIKAEYLHSEVKTLDRPEILRKLRTGEHDVIVGINLLREGLDLPEVSFIAVLDADKEGFLRNETTLLQIIGRAARHTDGKVILYADTMTRSMRAAMGETDRRRLIQKKYNKAHGVNPKQIKKEIRASMFNRSEEDSLPLISGTNAQIIKELEREMKKAARQMDFERAAQLRDRIKNLTKK
ncbi:MAG: excinuclease ABC subunit UvrB [Candidatus Sungiibacteriota bacterium]